MSFCKRGHPRTLDNTYFRGGRYWCRPCQTESRPIRRKRSDVAAIERDIRWMIDLPNIIEEADAKARLTSDVHTPFPGCPMPPLPGDPKDI